MNETTFAIWFFITLSKVEVIFGNSAILAPVFDNHFSVLFLLAIVVVTACVTTTLMISEANRYLMVLALASVQY